MTETIYPGIYDSIKIINGANVTISPGIYIIKADQRHQRDFDQRRGERPGHGVMFYNTGSDFAVGTG